MTELIFAIPRTRYPSYTDYYRLVEVSGFRQCHVDEIDLAADAVYVVTPINGEFRPHIENEQRRVGDGGKRAKLAWYNLERPIEVAWEDLAQSTKPVYATTVKNLDFLTGNNGPEYVDEMWVADRSFAAALQSPVGAGGRVRFVPLGSAHGLADSAKRGHEFDYDFAHLSYVTGRRDQIYGKLMELGLRCMPNEWPPERERLLARTRLMLNVHQTDHLITEPLRFAVAAANKIPLVSETMTDPWPMVAGTHFLEYPHGGLVDGVRAALGGDHQKTGEALHRLLCHEFAFKRNMTEAFEALHAR